MGTGLHLYEIALAYSCGHSRTKKYRHGGLPWVIREGIIPALQRQTRQRPCKECRDLSSADVDGASNAQETPSVSASLSEAHQATTEALAVNVAPPDQSDLSEREREMLRTVDAKLTADQRKALRFSIEHRPDSYSRQVYRLTCQVCGAQRENSAYFPSVHDLKHHNICEWFYNKSLYRIEVADGYSAADRKVQTVCRECGGKSGPLDYGWTKGVPVPYTTYHKANCSRVMASNWVSRPSIHPGLVIKAERPFPSKKGTLECTECRGYKFIDDTDKQDARYFRHDKECSLHPKNRAKRD